MIPMSGSRIYGVRPTPSPPAPAGPLVRGGWSLYSPLLRVCWPIHCLLASLHGALWEMSHKSTGEHLVQSLSVRPGEEDVQAMGLSDGGDSWVCLSTVPRHPSLLG